MCIKCVLIKSPPISSSISPLFLFSQLHVFSLFFFNSLSPICVAFMYGGVGASAGQ